MTKDWAAFYQAAYAAAQPSEVPENLYVGSFTMLWKGSGKTA